MLCVKSKLKLKVIFSQNLSNVSLWFDINHAKLHCFSSTYANRPYRCRMFQAIFILLFISCSTRALTLSEVQPSSSLHASETKDIFSTSTVVCSANSCAFPLYFVTEVKRGCVSDPERLRSGFCRVTCEWPNSINRARIHIPEERMAGNRETESLRRVVL